MTKPLSENAILLSTVILSIGSLFFLLLLLVSYFSKDKLSDLRNKLYKFMLIVNLVLIVTEVFEPIILVYISNPVLLLFTYRIHWFTGILWFSLSYIYSIVFLDNINTTKFMDFVNNRLINRFMTLIIIAANIIYFFLPFDYKLMREMDFFPGIAAYFVYAFCLFIEITIVLHLLFYSGKADFRKRLTVWVLGLFLVFIFMLQIVSQWPHSL